MKDSNEKTILKSTMELLKLITPGPLGEGMSQKEAAKELGITPDAVQRRLKTFKERHPEAFKNFINAIKLARKHRCNLKKVRNIPDFVWLEDQNTTSIVEKW